MEGGAIAQFASITGSSPALAAQYLRLADNNTEQAIELFFANDGADLDISSQPQRTSNPPPIPPPFTRPPVHRQGYQDEDGIVHLDSDQEDQDYSDGNDVELISQGQRELPTARRSTSGLHNPSNSPPPIARATGAVDDDEAMARRLQEEYYGAAGGGASGSGEMLDEHGYRAPIGRTTETLVGPGSFDPTNEGDMRAAVLEQIAARRQMPRQRGESFHCPDNINDEADGYRSSWYIQPGHNTLDMERSRQSSRGSQRTTCPSYGRSI